MCALKIHPPGIFQHNISIQNWRYDSECTDSSLTYYITVTRSVAPTNII